MRNSEIGEHSNIGKTVGYPLELKLRLAYRIDRKLLKNQTSSLHVDHFSICTRVALVLIAVF